MDIIDKHILDFNIPKMVDIRQNFERPVINDISKIIKQELGKEKIKEKIKKGDKVAITMGSRGISNIVTIAKELVEYIKDNGAYPYIIPSMGSHGGATDEGQEEVLKSLGISKDTVGAPIVSSMEVVNLGYTDSGLPVYFDKCAAEFDATIVINRIKAHTSFTGKIQSGLAKMIVIGLGKQKGAELCHSAGMENMSARIEEIAGYALEKSNIVFGIGIIENAYEETCVIKALPNNEIIEKEPELLQKSIKYMPQILFNNFDILIVDEIGKNISGTGMDTNVVGRFTNPCIPNREKMQKIVILDLSKETHGNANGIGLGDVISQRLLKKIDFKQTMLNSLTSKMLTSVKTPIAAKNDLQAIKIAISTCTNVDRDNLRIIRIKNTLCLDNIKISENMLDEAKSNKHMEILSKPKTFLFNNKGNIF